ncbi:MAG: hypothetical protein RLZZ200_2229 [Pseudomonadota bacterium]
MAWLGALTIFLMIGLILSRRVSPVVAMILVPFVAATLLGDTGDIPKHALAGIATVAPSATMFIFAILFFGLLTDAGVLSPLVDLIVRAVGDKPSRITVGTALLALLIHLDGSGAVCFLVAIPAMRPLYERVGMDLRVLACCASMAAGVNFLPWTGPTIRAGAALGLPVQSIFAPLVPAQLAGLVFVFAASWYLGRREERRLARIGCAPGTSFDSLPAGDDQALRRELPRLFFVNAGIALAVVGAMVGLSVHPAVAFMAGTALLLLVNSPGSDSQRDRIEAHARPALTMASILLAAGVFTGIINGLGMTGALGQSLASAVPAEFGQRLPLLLGVVAMPLSLLFDPDSFYFGVLPVLSQAAASHGVEAVEMARAALLGQMTTGFPISPLTPATFLVAGLCGIDLAAHQRFSIPWLFAASLVMLAVAVLTGAVPA